MSSVRNLRCKECGAGYELGASYFCEQCFGPLEVTYDFSGLDAEETRRRIQAGSGGIWRYSDFLPFEGQTGDPLEPGMTPLLRLTVLPSASGPGPRSGSRMTPPTRPIRSRTGS